MQKRFSSYPGFFALAVMCVLLMGATAQPVCSTIPNTDGSDAINGECTCRDSTLYTWNGNTNTCDANCASDPNAAEPKVPLTDGTCACNPNYVFNNEHGVCWIDCPNLVNTDGTASTDGSTCACASPTTMTWTSPSCVMTCSSLLNNDNVDGGTTCNCNSGYTWSTTNYVCEADCANDAYAAAPKTPLADGTCQCITSFNFNSETAACEIDCGSIAHATTPSASTSTCNCDNAAFQFNTETFTCDLNCTSVAGSESQVDATTCQCGSGLVWNPTTFTCDIDCSLIHYAVAYDGAGGCTCQDNFNWQASTKTCVVNCSQYSYTQAEQDDDEEYNECDCQAHFKWLDETGVYNSSKLGCRAVCKDDENSQMTYDPANPNICLCNPGFAWSLQRGRCQIVCSGQFNTGTTLGLTKCKCVQNTFWNRDTNTCELICARIGNTNNAPAVNGACVCKANYAWNPISLRCYRIV